VLAACDPGDPSNPDNWPSYSKLAPHLLATARWGEHNPAWRTMLLDTIRYFGVRGDARASRQIAQQSLERWVVALGSTHPSSLSLASTLTAALAWLGEGERACELGRDTLHKSRQTLGPDHPTTLGAATYLTSALAWTGANAEAANLGHDTLDRCRRTLGPDHRTTGNAGDLHPLAVVGLARIALVGELDVDAVRARCQLRHLRELFLGLLPEPLGHLGAPTGDHDLHYGFLLRIGGRAASRAARLGPGVAPGTSRDHGIWWVTSFGLLPET